MTRHILFAIFLVISCLYAACRGGTPERIASGALLGSAILSIGVARPLGPRFADLEIGILLVDALTLGILLWLSIRSTRFWPLWVAAMLGAETAIHIMRAVVPAIVPVAYRDAQALWSWVIQLMLLVGTIRHAGRLQREGADAAWKAAVRKKVGLTPDRPGVP